MNFINITLHCLDLRDFHSRMRDTPFLDELRRRAVFIPLGRSQGHHGVDSLNAELTGQWTARHCDSSLGENGYREPKRCWMPETVMETLQGAGYELITAMNWRGVKETRAHPPGSFAVHGGMGFYFMKECKERLAQFSSPDFMELDGWLERVKAAKGKFYAHIILRETHRPWDDNEGLSALAGTPTVCSGWPEDAFVARKVALTRPDEFAQLRRRGLARADRIVQRVFEETKHLKDVVYLVQSNHGEVYDHFRYILPHTNDPQVMISGTSHGPYPYEVVYANMQLWTIPGQQPRVMRGVGRTIDVPATMLELAGVAGGPMDGESMLGQFADGVFPERDRYAETGPGGGLSLVRADGMKFLSTGIVGELPEQKAVAPTKWGLYNHPPRLGPDGKQRAPLAHEHHRVAVFDLRTDPWEYMDLSETPLGREVRQWAIEKHATLKPFPGQEPPKK